MKIQQIVYRHPRTYQSDIALYLSHFICCCCSSSFKIQNITDISEVFIPSPSLSCSPPFLLRLV